MTGEPSAAKSSDKTRALFGIAALYVVALGGGAVVGLLLPFATPLAAALAADLTATAVVFVASRLTGNSSLYDAYWSVVPPFIAAFWVFTLMDGGQIVAQVLPLAIVLVPLLWWAFRLTGNWIRRWNGPKDEDWRYGMLKQKFGRFDWCIDLLGIHLLPTLQVFVGMIPLYYFLAAIAGTQVSVTWLVAVGSVIMAAAVILESVADRALARYRADGRSGVLRTGVWAVVRHPNYLGEILFWWGLWAASVAGGAPYWTIVGPGAMTALFLFISIPMMDRHLATRERNADCSAATNDT